MIAIACALISLVLSYNANHIKNEGIEYEIVKSVLT